MRADDWKPRLDAWVQSVERHKVFDWQTFNCGFLVADAAVAMGFDDPFAEYRDAPVERLKEISAYTLLEIVPFTQQPVAFARAGDWLAYRGICGGPWSLAVCLGKVALGFNMAGVLERVDTLDAVKSYKVD